MDHIQESLSLGGLSLGYVVGFVSVCTIYYFLLSSVSRFGHPFLKCTY